MREHTLQVKHLQIAFRTGNGLVRAVRDISFRLEKGRTLAIVGGVRVGKIRYQPGNYGAFSPQCGGRGGEILYKGKDLLQMPEKELCKLRGSKIAMIFQDPLSALDPIMPIGKQIAETMVVNRKMSWADAKNKAIRLMEEVGIRDAKSRYSKYPFEFSGGMRQRIVIAIALAADPEILICDEPTTALDVTIQAQILELINKLKAERHLSVIFITHDLGVVANVADDIAVMYAGKIVERGTAEDIFYDPRHPYTWALLTAMPDLETAGRLEAIPGAPPNMLESIVGDAFAPRNPYAMEIDFEEQPPMFEISPTHAAATWLLHPNAPKVSLPKALRMEGGRQNG